jgi:micrococcal nuclease
MTQRIFILTLVLGTILASFSGISMVLAQFTDHNDHDPGIPSWIKNTAGWWADDSISEAEFLRAIQYLIEEQIIKVTVAKQEGLPDITSTFTLPAGRNSEFVKYKGIFEQKHEGPLTLTIMRPDKSEFQLTTVARNGEFTATMELRPDAQIGVYVVFAEIEGKLYLVSAFEVKDNDANKVPVWIKNNASWWAKGKITDSDFVQGIEFLVSNGVIYVPAKTQDTKTEIQEVEVIKPAEFQECSGSARCIEGRVNRIVDGDTIEVNGQSIRFALASAAEIDQPEGLDARAFIDRLCPVGNKVKVDEDDGQVNGSFGRIIAVVYCNGMNLNAELLDANLGYLSAGFCSTSEFSGTPWAQKHGCSPDAQHTGKTMPESCDPSYPDVCIPSPPPDLDCEDIEYRNFAVLQPDPHGFDGNYDGIGCES